MNLIFIILLTILGQSTTNDQLNPPLDVLNEYAEFSNECIHGLLIIHRLLENFNQELNKKITGGQQLNFYNNDDLPMDIFEDPKHWFFVETPYQLINRLEAYEMEAPDSQTSHLLTLSRRMLNICKAANKIRFDLETYMKSHDMNTEIHQRGLFKLLESGVKIFDDFYLANIQMESELLKLYQAPTHKKRPYFNRIYEAHFTNKSILRSLRSKADVNYEAYLTKLKESISKIEMSNDATQALNGEPGALHSNIITKIIEGHDNAHRFVYTALVPQEYKHYGKFYFYHNSQIINKMNRYGNGYVKEVNELIAMIGAPELYLLEEPHFFQVTYPDKLDETDAITSSDDLIEQLPEQLLDRDIKPSDRVIQVDSLIFTIKLFDHKLADGDIVSINYNGDWILEDYSLEEKPVDLEIQLNKDGKNYLLLHAESIGRRPPNTMGLSYFFNGIRQEIVLKSDLNQSELIEIEYVDPSR